MAASNPQDDSKLTAIDGGKGKLQQSRKIGLLPSSSAASETPISYQGKIVAETTWNQLLPRKGLFSVNPNGSRPCYKISKSSYADLTTNEVITNVPVGSQQKVYRISLV